MTKRAVLLCLLLGAAFLLGGCGNPAPDEKPPSALTFLSFSESSSYFKRVQGYEFRAEDGKATAYFYMANEEEPYPVPVEQSWVDQLEGFISRYNMISWDGFRGSDPMLLDGTQFSIDLAFADGTAVRASGYGQFPAGYGEASEALDAHFMQLLPENMRDW